MEEFLEKNGIEIICRDGEYVTVRDKYGICRINFYHLKALHKPTIQSSIDKNDYFSNQAIELHGNSYSYDKVEYVNAQTKVLVTCNNHGDFMITPNSHLSKNGNGGCPVCHNILIGNNKRHSIEGLIEKFRNIHGHKYGYDKILTYNRQSEKVSVECKTHGYFTISAKDHIRGHGCPDCGRASISAARKLNPTGWSASDWIKSSSTSKEFDSFKMYIIECYNDNERFLKIGRTFKKTSGRFRTKYFMPYKYNVLNEIVSDGRTIVWLETEFKNELSSLKYLPKIEFNGMHECFDISAKERILNLSFKIGK